MFKPTGVGKATYSRDGRALDGEITRIFHAGPIDVLVVSMGATQAEVDAQADLIMRATTEQLSADQQIADIKAAAQTVVLAEMERTRECVRLADQLRAVLQCAQLRAAECQRLRDANNALIEALQDSVAILEQLKNQDVDVSIELTNARAALAKAGAA